jgi:hypothetical protein
MTAPLATYDFPWGTRPICPNEHERSIGGDGYGDRCCGTADVMVVQESDAECPRHFCEECCGDLCCRSCHAASVLEDAEHCPACQADQVMARHEGAA